MFYSNINKVNINSNKELLYPHQIKIVQNSNEKALVKNSYFRGNYWLIEAEYNNQVIFLKHALILNTEEIVSLKFNRII